jgi:hypothetical protein
MTAPVKKKPAPYHKVFVEMKDGFKYKFVCIGRNLENMLNYTKSFYWTESVKHEEISEADYRGFYAVSLEDEEKPKKKPRKKK